MSSADVRAILSLPDNSGTAEGQSSRKAVVARRPDGVSRELYALIGDNASALTAGTSATRIRPSGQRSTAKGSHWRLASLPSNSRDQSALRHWILETDVEDARARYFQDFDRQGPSVMAYSQAEYDQHLIDDQWSQAETSYLFSLLREYDLRFMIVADRYAFQEAARGSKRRSIEDIKDRYYTICRRLVRSRAAADPVAQQHLVQAYAFDKGREVRRKQYASELFHLTAAEIAEEEALYLEIKRMEQNEKRYRSDRDALMRSVMGLDSGLVDLSQAHGEGVVGMDKNRKRKRGEEPEPVVPLEPPQPAVQDEEHLDVPRCIFRTSVNNTAVGRYPAHVPVHMRSSKIPMPRPASSMRTGELLGELGISTHRMVMPTRGNLEIYDQVLASATSLIEMKRQVDRVEQEIRTLRSQSKGFVAPVQRRVTDRSVSIMSSDY